MPMTNKQYQEMLDIDERHVTYFLKREDKETSLFCMYCKNKLMVFQYSVTMAVPGDAVEAFPVVHKCSNKKCNTHYHFQFPV